MPTPPGPRGRIEIRVDACRNLRFKTSSDVLKKRVGGLSDGANSNTSISSGETLKQTVELKTRVAGFFTEKAAARTAPPTPDVSDYGKDSAATKPPKERSIVVKISMGSFSQSATVVTASTCPEFSVCPKLEFPVDHLQHHVELSVYKSRRVRGTKKIGGALVPLSALVPENNKAPEYSSQVWQALLPDLRYLGVKTAGEAHLAWTFFRDDSVPRPIPEIDPQSEAATRKALLLKKQKEHRKLFGGTIEDGLECTVCHNSARVPGVLFEAVEYLRANCLTKEGLFRISGSSDQIEKLKERAESMKQLQLEEFDVHVITGFVKKYLRELASPAIPFMHYDYFLELADAIREDEGQLWTEKSMRGSFEESSFPKKPPDELTLDETQAESCLEKFRILLASIPECNRLLLIYLMGFLETVATHSDTNKMAAWNLAIVFAPNLWRPAVDTADTLRKDAARCVNCCFIFIHSAQAMFWKLNKHGPEVWTPSFTPGLKRPSDPDSRSNSPIKPSPQMQHHQPPPPPPSFAASNTSVTPTPSLPHEVETAPWWKRRPRSMSAYADARDETKIEPTAPPSVSRLKSEPLEVSASFIRQPAPPARPSVPPFSATSSSSSSTASAFSTKRLSLELPNPSCTFHHGSSSPSDTETSSCCSSCSSSHLLNTSPPRSSPSLHSSASYSSFLQESQQGNDSVRIRTTPSSFRTTSESPDSRIVITLPANGEENMPPHSKSHSLNHLSHHLSVHPPPSSRSRASSAPLSPTSRAAANDHSSSNSSSSSSNNPFSSSTHSSPSLTSRRLDPEMFMSPPTSPLHFVDTKNVTNTASTPAPSSSAANFGKKLSLKIKSAPTNNESISLLASPTLVPSASTPTEGEPADTSILGSMRKTDAHGRRSSGHFRVTHTRPPAPSPTMKIHSATSLAYPDTPSPSVLSPTFTFNSAVTPSASSSAYSSSALETPSSPAAFRTHTISSTHTPPKQSPVSALTSPLLFSGAMTPMSSPHPCSLSASFGPPPPFPISSPVVDHTVPPPPFSSTTTPHAPITPSTYPSSPFPLSSSSSTNPLPGSPPIISSRGGPPPPPPGNTIQPLTSAPPPIPPKRRSCKLSEQEALKPTIIGGGGANHASSSLAISQEALQAISAVSLKAKPARRRSTITKSPRAASVSKLSADTDVAQVENTPKSHGVRKTELENLHDVTTDEDYDFSDSEGLSGDDDDSDEEEPIKVDLEPARLNRTISTPAPP